MPFTKTRPLPASSGRILLSPPQQTHPSPFGGMGDITTSRLMVTSRRAQHPRISACEQGLAVFQLKRPVQRVVVRWQDFKDCEGLTAQGNTAPIGEEGRKKSSQSCLTAGGHCSGSSALPPPLVASSPPWHSQSPDLKPHTILSAPGPVQERKPVYKLSPITSQTIT